MSSNSNNTVTFTAMRDGTVEDYLIIQENDQVTAQELPERIMNHLREMALDDGAYQISRLDHVLQCATRAFRDNADDDWIAAALLHDLGDVLAPYSHGQVASEIIRPFVKKEVAWVVQNHGVFQMYYNKSLSSKKRNSRDQFKHHSYFQLAADFCEKWDQCSFDPDYPGEALEFFEPLIRRVFLRDPFTYD